MASGESGLGSLSAAAAAASASSSTTGVSDIREAMIEEAGADDEEGQLRQTGDQAQRDGRAAGDPHGLLEPAELG